MKSIYVTLCTILVSFQVQAKLIKTEVAYTDGDAKLKGYLVYDDVTQHARPGVLVVHNWMGLSDQTKANADKLAFMGYVAFAADIYGEGVRPKDSDEAGKLAGQYKTDRKTYRSRLNAALDQLKSQKNVNTSKLAAIGYCFGGTGVIELARSGANVKGIVSFHGGLDSPTPDDGKNIKAKVLALHGADDPFEKREDLDAFENEMRKFKVDWQLVKYGNAVHSFTDPTAGKDNSKGAAYNELADHRSWQDMKNFFGEIFR